MSCLAVKYPPAHSTDPDPPLSWKRLAAALRTSAHEIDAESADDLLEFAKLLEALAELEASQAASELAAPNRSI